jgi:hypothetical protein
MGGRQALAAWASSSPHVLPHSHTRHPTPPTPPAVSYLEKHLEMLNEFMGDMAKIQDSQAYVQRRILRMQREREEWVARRRKENEERAMSGMSLLPEEDYSLPFFKPIQERGSGAKEPLEAHLMAAQVSNYCSNVTRFAHQNFGKLFLTQTMALKQQQQQ